MTSSILKQSRLIILMLAPILVVSVLVVFLPPDGNERAEWMQFLGHFHPLLVHFPIALFLLVPILEVFGRNARFGYLRLSAEFVLFLALLSATAAAILGWCLGRSGGYSGTLMMQHMWGGVALLLVSWVCWLLRVQRREVGMTYAIALAVGVGVVTWTGYRGGQISLGSNDLTEHMPEGLRSLLRVEEPVATANADPNSFYGARIQPIFATRCISCHNANKKKGNLRLDSYPALIRGGKDGPVIVAGNPERSELLRRISLPANHDDFMPKGKQPITADQIKSIELWIRAGASESLPVEAIKNAPSGPATVATAEVKFEDIDPATVAKLRSAIAPAVSQLQKQFPNILDYDSRGSVDLRLNASVLGSKFGDHELHAFLPIAEDITVADLSRTAITDDSADAIVAMKRLRVLQLRDTHLTDNTLLRLGTLDRLESLNAYGTPITPAVLPMIAKLPKLTHFYAGHTEISSRESVPEGLAGKLVF